MDIDPTEEAKTIVKVAQEKGVTLRVIGGVAIRLHCHGQHSKHLREYDDIDVFGFRKESEGIRSFFEKMLYVPNMRYRDFSSFHTQENPCPDLGVPSSDVEVHARSVRGSVNHSPPPHGSLRRSEFVVQQPLFG
jgi:hypothetical protein